MTKVDVMDDITVMRESDLVAYIAACVIGRPILFILRVYCFVRYGAHDVDSAHGPKYPLDQCNRCGATIKKKARTKSAPFVILIGAV